MSFIKNIKSAHKNIQITPKKVENIAKKATQEDALNRSLFTQFLNFKLSQDNPDKLGNDLIELRNLEQDILKTPPSKNMALASLYDSLYGYLLSNPNEKSRKKMSELMTLFYNNPNISDLFNIKLNIDTNQLSQPELRNIVNQLIKQQINTDELSFNNKYPEYLIRRISKNIPSIIERMNDVEDGLDETKQWYKNYKNININDDQLRYAKDIIGNIEYMVKENKGYETIPVYGIGGKKYMTYNELYKELSDKFFKDMNDIYDFYGKLTNKQYSFNKSKEHYLSNPGVATMLTPVFETEINNLFNDEKQKQNFVKDMQHAFLNAAVLVDNTQKDNINERNTYLPYFSQIPHIERLKEYNNYIKNKTTSLNDVRLKLANNPFIPNSLLDTGDESHINIEELINYLAKRSIKDIKQDNTNFIENIIFNPEKKQDLIDYYNKVPFDKYSDYTTALYQNRYEDIDPKLYPLIYDYYSKFNYPAFKQITNDLKPIIADKIQTNVNFAKSLIEDRKNVIRNFMKVNQLLANQPNVNLIPFLEKISVSNLGENELKQQIAELQVKDTNETLTDEQKEDLTNAIMSLKRVKDSKNLAKKFLETYHMEQADREKLFAIDDDLIRKYTKSITALENIINNNTEDYFDWKDYAKYYAKELRNAGNIEEAENIAKNAISNLRITNLAGLDTTVIEEYINNLLDLKKNKGNGSLDKDSYKEDIKQLIQQVNHIADVNLREDSTLSELQQDINNLPDKVKTHVSDTIKNLIESDYTQYYDNLHSVLTSNKQILDNHNKQIKEDIEKQLLENNKDLKNFTREQFDTLWNSMTEAINNKDINKEEKILDEFRKLGIDAENNKTIINKLITDFDAAKIQIAEERKQHMSDLEKLAARYSQKYDDVTKILNNITIKPDMSEINVKFDDNIKEFRGYAERYLSDSKKIIDGANQDYRNIINDLTELNKQTNEKLNKQMSNLNDLMENINSNQKDQTLIDAINSVRNDVNRFHNNVNKQIKTREQYNKQLADTIENVINNKTQDQKEQFENLHLAFQSAAEDIKEQQQIAKGLEGRLKDIWDEVHGDKKKIVSKEELYKARYDSIFKDENKVRDALLKNTINITEDENIKEKFFREKISQEKLKKALGFLPSDPDLKLSDVEKYLPDGFFADLQMNIQDKNMAPIKLKTTNYKAINEEATGGINNSLKNKLLKLYIYYKDPNKRTIKKDEYPREFLNDLAMLNVNGSPSDIITKYTKYLKTGSL